MPNFIFRESKTLHNKTFEHWLPLVLKLDLYIIHLGLEFVAEAVKRSFRSLIKLY